MNRNATAYCAGRGQGDALLGHLLDEEGVRNLHQHAGAVAHQRVGAHGAAMLEVFEDGEAALDDRVLRAVLEVDDEADATGIMLALGVVQAERSPDDWLCERQSPRRGVVPFRLGAEPFAMSFVRGRRLPASRYRVLSTRLASGSYIVRLRLRGAILFVGERLCIQMAARSGSSPRLPFPLSTSGPAGSACELYRGDRGPL